MRQLSDVDFRNVEIGILQHFDEFCHQNGLNYSLAEGTLIGAARHKGFIPWDDDVDIIMLREDYDKFVETHRDDRYQIVSARNNSIYPYSFVRVQDTHTILKFNNPDNHTVYNGGIWMDIFPIDNFPDDDKIFKKQERKIFIFSNLYRIKSRKQWCRSLSWWRNLVWLFTKILLIPIPRKWLRKKLYVFMTSFNSTKTSRMGYWTNYWHKPWVFPSTAFEGFSSLEFEGRNYSVLKNYDEYLRSEYGDYMQLPPVSMQVAKHGFTAYDLED